MLDRYLPLILIVGGAIILFLVISLMIMASKIGKLKKQIDIFTMGLEDVNLEKVLKLIQKDIRDIETANILKDEKIKALETNLNFTIRKVGFIKYNAFLNKEAGRGGELSFSIAFLDGFDNGFVLSSIYTSQTSVCYAKPIRNKKSKIPLSDEEMLAIERAIHGGE